MAAAPQPESLEITVFRANGLQHLNHFKSDAMFATFEVEHTDKRTHPSKAQTKVATEGGLNPVWNETIVLQGWLPGERLEIGVFDKGWMGSKAEGKLIYLDSQHFENGLDGALPIDGLDHANIELRIVPSGIAQQLQGEQPTDAQPAMDYGAPAQPAMSYGAPAAQPAPGQPYVAPETHGATHAGTHATHGATQAGTHDPRIPGAQPEVLEITFLQANGLQHLNHFKGDSMFAVCEVVHTEKKAKVSKVQTKPAPPGLDPVWNETLLLHDYIPGEPLEIAVYDKGWLGSKQEGKQIILDYQHFANGLDGALPIDGLDHAIIDMRIQSRGPQPATQPAAHQPSHQAAKHPSPRPETHHTTTQPAAVPATYSTARPETLEVTFVRAFGLQHLNHFKGDSMFAVCEVQHTTHKAKPSKVQTKLAQPGLEPIWNETLLLHDWTPGEGLEFSIYDKGWLGSKHEGKQVHLDSEQFEHGVEGVLPIEGLEHAGIEIRIRSLGHQPNSVPAAQPAQIYHQAQQQTRPATQHAATYVQQAGPHYTSQPATYPQYTSGAMTQPVTYPQYTSGAVVQPGQAFAPYAFGASMQPAQMQPVQVQPAQIQAFDVIDANHDGMISRAELAAKFSGGGIGIGGATQVTYPGIASTPTYTSGVTYTTGAPTAATYVPSNYGMATAQPAYTSSYVASGMPSITSGMPASFAGGTMLAPQSFTQPPRVMTAAQPTPFASPPVTSFAPQQAYAPTYASAPTQSFKAAPPAAVGAPVTYAAPTQVRSVGAGQALFNRLDANHDGSISRAEFARMMR